MNRRTFFSIPVAAQVAQVSRVDAAPRRIANNWFTVNQISDWSDTEITMGAKITFDVGAVVSIEETSNPNCVYVALTIQRTIFITGEDANRLREILGA